MRSGAAPERIYCGPCKCPVTKWEDTSLLVDSAFLRRNGNDSITGLHGSQSFGPVIEKVPKCWCRPGQHIAFILGQRVKSPGKPVIAPLPYPSKCL